ncbi:MAG: ATP-binding cassette domain-containing protein [Candidatus Omnitrophica bacterium]|nr:ATP-binding cassette domain-containing protein [Candidatus Omnitrophota bacterium]
MKATGTFQKIPAFSGTAMEAPAPLVAIFGSGRSGTTLTLRLLDGSEGLWVYPIEINLLSIFGQDQNAEKRRLLFREWAEKQIRELEMTYVSLLQEPLRSRGNPLDFLQEEDIGGNPASCLKKFLQSIRRNYDTRHLDGTPLLVFKSIEVADLAKYERLDPSMRFIHIIRDPLTNYASLKRTDMIAKKKPFWFQGGDILRLQLEGRWIPHARQVMDRIQSQPQRHYLVRYEEICSQPAKTITALCRWLGVSAPRDIALQTVLGGRRMKELPANPSKPSVKTPEKVIADMAGTFGYEEVVTPREREFIICRTAALAKQLDYKLPAEPAGFLRRLFLTLAWLLPDKWEVGSVHLHPRWLSAFFGRRLYIWSRLLFPVSSESGLIPVRHPESPAAVPAAAKKIGGKPVIEITGLGKQYRIGQRERYIALRDTLVKIAQAPFQQKQPEHPPESTFWALKDVDLMIQPGEVLGVIGPNGAGKSTLLKILSRITEPTQGKAIIRGRVGSLLEVGTGFHPELTGRENIYLNGAILGMQRSEIRRKFDEIVDFSGIEQFIDTPVKRYSSGMYVRLAFAVAAHLEPEILLVDEVLAVGDASFQRKCLGKMSQVAHSGRTIFFVSHNMSAIRNLCSRAICLDGGRLISDGETDKVILDYLSRDRDAQGQGHMDLLHFPNRGGSGTVRITSFEARPGDMNSAALRTGADAEFYIGYRSAGTKGPASLNVIVTVLDGLGDSIFMCMPAFTPLKEFRDLPPAGIIQCRIKNLPLIPGRYTANLSLKDEAGVADVINGAVSFDVIDAGESGLSALPCGRWGKIVVTQEWEYIENRLPGSRDAGGRIG